MVHQNIRSEIAGIANRSIIVILLILLIPIFFWVINFTVMSIVHIIIPDFIHGEKLANIIGALGFTDGINHQDWNYDVGYPDLLVHYEDKDMIIELERSHLSLVT